ncbi:DUF418 domain-containing protein [Streptomyces harbinensis]|uniref:DUF418 domain-containing protein n=1 Tax=Streptomyces harbinensis TaxID=1176198 RepID=UPI003394FAF6
MSETTRRPAPPTGTPAGGTGRLPLLDVLRGVAILGTLMTNIWIFAGPGAEWGVLTGGLDTPGLFSGTDAAGLAETVFRLLADGKFLALLTVLFGAGLAIQYDAARRRGAPWPGRYRLRALFLFAEGLVHFVLIFAWDVLMGYALVSLLVAWLLTRSEGARGRVLRWAAVAHLTVMTLLTLALLTAPAEDGPGGSGPSQRVIALYAEGSWAEQIAFRLENALILRAEPLLSFGLLLFLFLLGVRLYRAGAFAPGAAGERLRRRLMRWGLGAGIPLTLATGGLSPDLFLLGRYVAAPVLALGYLGAIGVLLDRRAARAPGRAPGQLTASLTAVGRTALSCYVGQNLLAALACYGAGLGLATRFADSGPWWVMALWAVIGLLLVAGARLWLRYADHGPLESLQRRVLRR